MEKLLPWDPVIAVAHPERIRHASNDEYRATEIHVFSNGATSIISAGRMSPDARSENGTRQYLRIAPATRKVMMRNLQSTDGTRVRGVPCDEIENAGYGTWIRIGDPFEIEVPEIESQCR